jgi:LAS superfamily LD-carboxypeptidase LdcB
VRGIQVDATLVPPLTALLDAADQRGLALGGSGYRSHDQQIALRQAHCGTSHYAVYDMPADACTPPTARPGESLHETGLAIDFACNGVLVTRDDACFAFLAETAADYGLANLPSEPWHWSVTGR